MKENRKKNNLLINPEFQFKFIKHSFYLLVVVYIIVLVVGSWVLSPIIEQVSSLNLPKDHDIWLILDNFKGYILFMSGMLFIVLTCIFTMAALIISHRIVGPIKNLQNATQRMGAAKKLTKIYFRKNDYFKSLEKDFNEMVDQFES